MRQEESALCLEPKAVQANKDFINFLLVSVETAYVLLQSWWARLSTGASREAWMAYTIAQYVRSRMLAHYSHVCYCFVIVIVLAVVVRR